MRANLIAGVFGVALYFAGTPASGKPAPARSGADAVTAVGSILAVDGKAEERRLKRGGRTREARAGEFLYVGDKIVVAGAGGAVELLIQGETEPVQLDSDNPSYTVRSVRRQPVERRILRALDQIIWPSSVSSFIVRDPTQRRGDATSGVSMRQVQTIAYSPWNNSGVINLPHGQDHVSVTWCGDAGGAELRRDGRRVATLDDKGGFARATNLSDAAAEIIILDRKAVGTRLSFAVHRVAMADVPRPDWLTPTDVDATAQTAWAAWLLRSAPAEYHGFALTLLDDAKFETAAAAQFFAAATDCETALQPN